MSISADWTRGEFPNRTRTQFESDSRTFWSLRDINHIVLPSLAPESGIEFSSFVWLGLMHPAWAPTDQAEGTIQVTTRVLHRAESNGMQSVPTFQLQFVPVRQSSLLEFPQSLAEASEQDNSSPSGSGCMRGIQSALAIEAVAALMFYGLWQLLHLLR